ncbi:MAG: hypothetical protein JWN04_498 [Myxococcaceae bacterium]|nr:hypothetical protein [Myxococcaceae bacterium]
MTGDTLDDGSSPDSGPQRMAVPRPMETESFGWKTCADTLQCGSIHVPIDYDQPDAGTLKVAVMRRRATGSRVGTLLMNPGGPGASTIDYLGFFVQGSTSPLLDRFDLVAFDPRGVGYSTSLVCHSKLQQLTSANPRPQSDAEWQALDDLSASFARECAQAENANLLPFLGTPSVARDMDRVRAALGEDKLDYLGFSYGTALGAWYAELFPARVGRMVLDGAIDLGLSALDSTLGQAKGFELALGHYFEWCGAVASRCPWTQGASPAQAFAALQAQVDAQPIAAPMADRPLGPGDLLVGVIATLYGGTAGWRALSPALGAALKGDASSLMGFVDGYLDRNADGSYTNFHELFYAVSCIDQHAPTVAEVRAAAPRFLSEAPTFGLFSLTPMLVCSHWAVTGHDVAPPTGQGAPKIVVVGTLNDPATPYAWAQAFASDLVSSVLLTSHLEGHTGYGRGDRCIDDAVNSFLFDAVVPADHCEGTTSKSRAVGQPFADFWALHRR